MQRPQVVEPAARADVDAIKITRECLPVHRLVRSGRVSPPILRLVYRHRSRERHVSEHTVNCRSAAAAVVLARRACRDSDLEAVAVVPGPTVAQTVAESGVPTRLG